MTPSAKLPAEPPTRHFEQDMEMPAPLPTDRSNLVYIADGQLAQLQDIADRAAAPGGDLLRRELDRAIVLTQDDSPTRFVRLNSTVTFKDLLSGRTRKLTLVLPQEADIDQRRASVATPIGAALLGLTPGQPFSWTAADGRPHALVVLAVDAES